MNNTTTQHLFNSLFLFVIIKRNQKASQWNEILKTLSRTGYMIRIPRYRAVPMNVVTTFEIRVYIYLNRSVFCEL